MMSAKQKRNLAFISDGRDLNGIKEEWFRSTPFIRYDPATGEILEHGTMSIAGVDHLAATNGWHYLKERGDHREHYVRNGRKRQRSSCPATLDGMILRGLPVPCRIVITSEQAPPQEYPMTDSEIALEFEHPGAYRVRVLAVPHADGVFEVVAS